jgi:hypothetical protein
MKEEEEEDQKMLKDRSLQRRKQPRDNNKKS